MSEHIVKIIPQNPFYKVSAPALQSVKAFLETQIHCDFIEVISAETPFFVDCGANLERISCPQCGTELDFGSWGEMMDKAAEDEFMSLETEMPCCKKTVSLNNLKYEFPCGFACCSVCIHNPEQFVKENMIDIIQNTIGDGIRIIEFHI